MVSSYASWAVSSVAAKVTGKSSDDASPKEAEDPKRRMGDIDRSKFNTNKRDVPLNKPKPKKKPMILDDDIDLGAGDDDFDFDFSDKEEEVESYDGLSLKKKKRS